MTRRRRGVLLAGLALVLGGFAASDVARREDALDRRIGALTDIVVARRALEEGRRVTREDLAVRRVPARFAPGGGFADPASIVGVRLATSVPAGADVPVSAIDAGRPVAPGSPARAGERVIDVIATGAPAAVARGARVDVLVTREAGTGARGRTTLALEDVEVVAARPAAVDERGGVARVTASLRVTLRQAVYLAAAQSFAREMRLLPRAAGDRRRHRAPVEVDDRL